MRLASMQGGVEIPKGERPWAKRLVGSFENLDPKIQGDIIKIISSIRQESPEKATEIAHRIGDFFSHTGDYAKDSNLSINDFLGELEGELQRERTKHIN